EGLASLFGLEMSLDTRTANAIPLPTELAGTRVTIRDSAGVERLAPLLFVSPTQINLQVPADSAEGVAQIKVTSNGSLVRVGEGFVSPISPGIFTANMDGRGVPSALLLRIKADGSSQYEPVTQFDSTRNQFVPKPIDLGLETDRVYLILFGTGVRNREKLEFV